MNPKNELLGKTRDLIDALYSLGDIDDILKALCKGSAEHLGYDICSAIVCDVEKVNMEKFHIYPDDGPVDKLKKLLNVPLTTVFSLSPDDVKSHARLKNGKTMVSNSFYEVIAPTFSKEVCDKAQDHLGIKSIVSIPFYYDKKLYGRMIATSRGSTTRDQVMATKYLVKNATLVFRNFLYDQKLKETNLVLKQTVDSLKSPVILIDNNHNIMHTNKAMIDFYKNISIGFDKSLGHGQDSYLNSKCYKFFHNRDYACSNCDHTKTIEQGDTTEEFRDKIHGHIYRKNISCLYDRQGNIKGTIHVLDEITDEVNANKLVDFQQRTAFLLTESNSTRELVGSLIDAAEKIFDIDCYINFTNEHYASNIRRFISRIADEKDIDSESLNKIIQDLIKQIDESASPVLISGFSKQRPIKGVQIITENEDIGPIIGIPARDTGSHDRSNRSIDILIRSRTSRALTSKELKKFKTIAERLSLTLAKHGLIYELTKKNYELEAINKISKKINQSVYIEVIIKESLDCILDILNLKAGAIKLSLQKDDEQVFYQQGISEKCLKWVNRNSSKSVDIVNWESRINEEFTGSCITLPIQSSSQQVGSIYLCCPKGRALNTDDLQLVLLIGRQIGIALDKALLYQKIEKEREIQRSLAHKIIESVENERKRISIDLHDNLLQLLVGTNYLLQSIDENTLAGCEKLSKIAETVSEAIHTGRKLITEIMPPSLEALGLSSAIEEFLLKSTSDLDIKVSFTGRLVKKLPNNIELSLFRIAQEAILNSIKHARATKINCKLVCAKGSINLSVIDDGRGFNIEDKFKASINNGHIGLLSMKERAALCGGILEFSSNINKGTKIEAKIPVGYLDQAS